MTHRFVPLAKSRRRFAKTPLVLFLLALAFQIAVPFAQSFAERASWNGAETVVLCTGTGLKTFTVNADGSLTELPEQAPPSSACEYCQVCPFGTNGIFGMAQFDAFAYSAKTVSASVTSVGFEAEARQAPHFLPATRGPPV